MSVPKTWQASLRQAFEAIEAATAPHPIGAIYSSRAEQRQTREDMLRRLSAESAIRPTAEASRPATLWHLRCDQPIDGPTRERLQRLGDELATYLGLAGGWPRVLNRVRALRLGAWRMMDRTVLVNVPAALAEYCDVLARRRDAALATSVEPALPAAPDSEPKAVLHRNDQRFKVWSEKQRRDTGRRGTVAELARIATGLLRHGAVSDDAVHRWKRGDTDPKRKPGANKVAAIQAALDKAGC